MPGLQIIGPQVTQKNFCILQKKVISLPKIPSIANCIYSLVLIYYIHTEKYSPKSYTPYSQMADTREKTGA